MAGIFGGTVVGAFVFILGRDPRFRGDDIAFAGMTYEKEKIGER